MNDGEGREDSQGWSCKVAEGGPSTGGGNQRPDHNHHHSQKMVAVTTLALGTVTFLKVWAVSESS